MDANVREWLHLCFRWMHLIAGIMWIGNSMFFAWLDRHILPVEGKAGSEGELWMVHSGGFYEVDKKRVALDQMPKVLHWFKWEAGFTWVSGFFLLIVVYYMGGGVYLTDPNVSRIGPGAATALGIGTLVLGWVAYDLMVLSPLGRMGWAAAALGYLLLCGVAFGLSQVLSGRAAYLHVGAMMGTLMAANVWMRIIPAQRRMVEATREGRKPDATQAKRAKQRSVHNHYMTFPLLFIMMSNHFPNTYGSKHGWLVLAVLMLAGAGVRYFMNMRDRSPWLLLGIIGAAVPVAALYSVLITPVAPAEGTRQKDPPAPMEVGPRSASVGGPAAPASGGDAVGEIHGAARFTGVPPQRKELTLPAGCIDREARSAAVIEQHQGPVLDNSVMVREGKVQNVFVWIQQNQGGQPEWKQPPQDEVRIDQRGCLYEPRVLGVQVGQRVTFINSDPVLHNVRTVAEGNGTFNELMAQKDMRLTKVFGKMEVMVHAKCDIHPWMAAYIGVLPHPYFAVTGSDGEYTLRNLPAGEYTLNAWHEVLGQKTQKVKVAAKTSAVADFSFAAK